MSRISYLQRLNRDVAELFAHNFNCSSSTLNVIQTSDYLQANGSLVLQISIYEGPYRGGCFLFSLNIPEAYPFRPVDIFAAQPIWHPNVDLFSGKVALPMEWSPVLTLNSLALAVQVPSFSMLVVFQWLIALILCVSKDAIVGTKLRESAKHGRILVLSVPERHV